jgi:ribonuclease E
MAEAQRKRWAESKAASEPSTPEVTPTPKRKLSEAGRKAIVAATKKRSALKMAEAAKTQQAATKKTAVKKAVAKKTATTSTLAAAKTAG